MTSLTDTAPRSLADRRFAVCLSILVVLTAVRLIGLRYSQVDLFFDDSVHENPWFRNNLRFWLRQMRPGGVMSGHDYCAKWPHVVQEVDQLAAELGVAVEVAGWVWSLRVPPDHAPSLPLRTRMRRTAEAVSRALGRRPSPRTRGV